MRIYLFLLFLLHFGSGFAQTGIERMIADLKQANFEKVYRVRDSIVDRQKDAIPYLIGLLKDTSFVKLKNTADLIYPGAEQFYGHGWIVNYDIDWIAVRSAWLLEELIFEDFGYRDLNITEEKLMDLHLGNYTSEYLKKGHHDVDFRNKTPRQKLIAYRLMLADSVSKWWDKNKGAWTRYDALKNALSSENEQRQEKALHYLRFGKTKCDGLTLEKYNSEIKPLVKKIAKGESSEAEQAQLLLDEGKPAWYEGKK